MRTRALVSLALLSLPMVASAQVVQRRPSQRTPVEPASLPPAAPDVARDLAYKRSRWALEAYSLFSAVQVPSAGSSTYSAVIGAGTHGDYRLTDLVAATADVTFANLSNTNMSYETAEAGTRFMIPIPDERTRPFVDVRATYMMLSDLYFGDVTTGRTSTSPGMRYSRGVGGFVGAGVHHSLFGSFLLTTELAALRNRMTTYRSSGLMPATGTNMWATTYRLTVGVRYNAQRSLNLVQNPRQ
jgi:hypothetical protein